MKIKFIKDWRVFKKDEVIEFEKDIVILAGDQGTGKSSLLESIKNFYSTKTFNKKVVEIEFEKDINVIYFDVEKDNFRVLSYFKDDILNQCASFHSSHGTSTIYQLKNLIDKKTDLSKKNLILLDEPDTALCIKSILVMQNFLKSFNSKVDSKFIISAHNPVFLDSFEEIYDIENRKFVKPKEFITRQFEEFNDLLEKYAKN